MSYGGVTLITRADLPKVMQIKYISLNDTCDGGKFPRRIVFARYAEH